MRIGGPFPFPITDPVFGGGTITLGSGGVFYPPSGQYIYSSGGVTQLQTWDPVQAQWRTVGDPKANSAAFDCDGWNWRFVNMSGTIQGALITNAGSGAINGIGTAATGVTLTFGPPTAGVTAIGYPIVGGAVVAPTVNQAGSGFLVPPTVVIDPPSIGGIQATAVATLTAGGGIASIVMVNAGAGYLTAPNFYLIPQANIYQGAPAGGIAAGLFPAPGLITPQNTVPGVAPIYLTGTGNALLNAATLTGTGTLTGIGMVSYGSNYTGTTIPAVTISGCGAAAATAVGSFTITGFTGLVGGSGYGAGNPPLWESSLGVVVTAGQLNNNDLSSDPAAGIAVLSGGTVSSLLIEDSGFGFQKVPVISIVNSSAIATVQAAVTAVVGGTADTTLLQAKVN